jgi:proteasome accessory factor C
MPADTAAAQLERILYILPAAARTDGVAVDVLASALGVDPATVLHDIEQVSTRAFYHPAGAVDDFTLLLDGETVEVHAPHEFRRPVRLSEREALALGLGLRTLAAEAREPRRSQILDLAHRLEAELGAPALGELRAAPAVAATPLDDVDYEDLALAFDDDGFRGVIADAIALRRVCTIWYLKPGDIAPAYRSIAPCRLIYADGLWYAAAWDMDREALRYFRMDRILDAVLEEDAAPDVPQDQLDVMLAGRVPFHATDEVRVRVRYSPRVARWLAERIAATLEPDGSLLLYHRVADPRWIVRHVLQYAGEAIIEEPESARHWVATSATDVAGGSG